MNFEEFITKYFSEEQLQEFAEEEHEHLQGLWDKHVTIGDINTRLNEIMKECARTRKVFPYPELIDQPKKLKILLERLKSGQIDVYTTAWGKEKEEQHLAKNILELAHELFWEKLRRMSQQDLITFIITESDFDVDALWGHCEIDLQEIANDLGIDFSDLDIERYHHKSILWNRIVAEIYPRALTFEETFIKNKDSHSDAHAHGKRARWWGERVKKVENLSQESDYSKWFEEQSEYLRWLNLDNERAGRENGPGYRDIRYLFYWIEGISKELSILSEKITELESSIKKYS